MIDVMYVNVDEQFKEVINGWVCNLSNDFYVGDYFWCLLMEYVVLFYLLDGIIFYIGFNVSMLDVKKFYIDDELVIINLVGDFEIKWCVVVIK